MLRASRRSTTSAGSGISMTNTMLTASAGTIQSPAPPATEFSNFGLVAILSPTTSHHLTDRTFFCLLPSARLSAEHERKNFSDGRIECAWNGLSYFHGFIQCLRQRPILQDGNPMPAGHF